MITELSPQETADMQQVMHEIISQVQLAENYSQLEFCRDEYQRRFLTVYCPTSCEKIIEQVTRFESLITERDEHIRGPRKNEIN